MENYTTERPLRLIELFAGIGSQTQALTNIGVPHRVVAISEIDNYAVKSYEAMHGQVINLGDIREIKSLPQADLWTYSFPCFVGDTLVLTDQGFRRIDEMQAGDRVLTHENRYSEVVKPYFLGERDVVKVKGMAFDEIVCTPNHRFLTRKRRRKYYHNPNRNTRVFDAPEWKEAQNLTKDDFLGIAVNQIERLPDWNGIICEWSDGRKPRVKNKLRKLMNRSNFWWMIGRYMGDGWVRSQGGIIICCAHDEAEELSSKLNGLFPYNIVKERTAYKIHIPQKELSEFVEQFGRGAANKRLTSSILDLPVNLLQSFLEGYVSADGCFTEGYYKACSVSRELIYGLGQCVAKAYHRPFSIYRYKRPTHCGIEGRTVNQKDSYALTFKKTTDKQDKAFFENGYVWFPVNGVIECGKAPVYDLQVEEDNSFTANGAIAHNCQDVSVAGKLGGIKAGTRSGLLFEVERLLRVAAEAGLLPKYLLLENVKNLVGKRFRADFDEWLAFLASLGYANYWKVLNAKDYGIPQNRERVFCVSIRGEHKPFVFPEKQKLMLRLRDMLESEVDARYYLKEATIKSILSSAFHSRRDSIRRDDQIANCLRARDFHEPQCVQVGELAGEKWDKMYEHSRRVYADDGISPTVHTAGGGNTEIKIAAMRGRNPDNPSDRTAGQPTEQRLEINEQGVSNTLTSVQKDNLVVEQAYVARKYKEFIKKHGYIPKFFNAYNTVEVGDVAKTITATCSEPSQSGAILKTEPTMRIRKLTPRECLRLMGWSDDQIDKIQAAKVSGTQQYKQAGNGIVVQVLEAIFKALFLS